jgi:hypothetical protein
MGSSTGPRQLVKASLLLSFDAADFPNSASPLGCGDFNGSTQGMRNNINGTVLPFVNGLKLTNRDFYTAFAIDYPEGSYGGDAANRQGITPGYNVRSGSKIYGFGRALHYAVWDRVTETWVLFETYDSYIGTGPVIDFVNRYNQMIKDFPNAIHIVAGSHRDSYHTEAQYNILRDLGAPNNVDSIIGFSAPEWILVGKPGLRPGNAYGWVFQNYPTNPDQVAHINFGIPKTGIRSSIEFDGSNDYLAHPSPSSFRMSGQNFTLETVIKQYDTGYQGLLEARGDSLVGYLWILNYGNSGGMAMFLNYGGNQYVHYQNGGFSATSTSQYYHLVTVVDRSTQVVQFYINGVQAGSNVSTQHQESISPTGGDYYHVGWDRGGSPLYGEMALFNHYNKALSAQEIAKNYANYKTRFNLP